MIPTLIKQLFEELLLLFFFVLLFFSEDTNLSPYLKNTDWKCIIWVELDDAPQAFHVVVENGALISGDSEMKA